MNPKMSGLVLAIPAAFALSLPVGALAHEGHAHSPGQTFEEGSQPVGSNGKKPADVGSQFDGNRNETLPRNGDHGQQPIPEPESYAMMLAGLGLLGAVVARRRRGKDEEAPRS